MFSYLVAIGLGSPIRANNAQSHPLKKPGACSAGVKQSVNGID